MRLLPPLLLAVVLLAACDSYGGDEPAPAPPPRAITRAELNQHLNAFQRIADRNGGTRAAGTPGYRASADYVADRLLAAGWRVRLQSLQVPSFVLRQSSVRIAGRNLKRGLDYQVLTYSGSGRVDGRMRRLRNGCAAEEFTGLAEGDVPVVGRSVCFFRMKAANAERAGAPALIVVDELPTSRGVPSGTLAIQGIDIPVVLVADRRLDAAGDGTPVSVAVTASSSSRPTHNVIAETPGGRGERVVMAGGHLDSVPGGPGINDNGSGVAALIEAAGAIGPEPPGARVRLAFWGAEEVGLVGSRHYVRSLSSARRRQIAAYLNFDMVGSPNAVSEVYVDGDGRLARLLRRASGRPIGSVAGAGGSDHTPFQLAGIPVNGLYTGGPERGPHGRPRDPCYHLACDTARNVNRRVLLRMARAAARALRLLSRQAK